MEVAENCGSSSESLDIKRKFETDIKEDDIKVKQENCDTSDCQENSTEIDMEVGNDCVSGSSDSLDIKVKLEGDQKEDGIDIKPEHVKVKQENCDVSDCQKNSTEIDMEVGKDCVSGSSDSPDIKVKLESDQKEDGIDIKPEHVKVKQENCDTSDSQKNSTDIDMEVGKDCANGSSDSLDTKVKIESDQKENEINIKPKNCDISDCQSTSTEPDLYSYTRLDDFTSEIYKIEITNLPKYVGYGQLRKLLHSTLNVNPRKLKAIGNPPHFAFVTFRNEEDRCNALEKLNGYSWKGKQLSAKKANPAADPMARKRKAGDSEDCNNPKKPKSQDIPVDIRLKNAVTPYWNVPYEEQLKLKENDIHKFLMKLSKEIEKVNKEFSPVLSKFKKENHYQCCPLIPIKPSPVTTAYRNKSEFTIGRHLLTKEKTVGFRLSAYKEGSMSVGEPDDCINIPPQMLKAVKSFEKYIRTSELDVYNPETHGGYWRQLTVRTSNNDDILLIVVMHPQSLSEEQLEEERTKLKDYYESGEGSSCAVTSVFFQLFSKKASHEETAPLTHLMGKKFLEESLLGMKFQVSPEAFFQINVPATEILYSMITDFVNPSASSTVFDICCGTGTISLCLAKAGCKVVGIELCSEAVENARINAQVNNLPNVEFICGKAEDVVHKAIDKCDSSEIVAVVDPPRAGLHKKVIQVIRSTTKIRKLIYIACNAFAAFPNFLALCRPTSNNYEGSPFYPVKAAVVDLFPYTPHKELILIFERYDDIVKESVE